MWLRRSLDQLYQFTAAVGFAPVGTPVAALVVATGPRWTMEIGCRETKARLGQDEGRSWTHGYRLITGVLAAQAFLAALQTGSKRKQESPLNT